MSGVYDASAPPPQEPHDARQTLRRLGRAAALSRLEEALGRIEDLTARVAEQEEAAGEDLVDPETVSILESLTHDEQAPLEWRSLGRRVDEGLTSWRAFWSRPQAEAGGVALLGATMREQAERGRLALQEGARDELER
ncbi:MAG: hypothetical protein OSB43_02285 [Nocardioides sp.]|uniref:hypothetical protein n=1 Tax=Nocardioides sp. TaxID=35761 RepID=UPI000C939366|nr:hypothetical protein [Nocardioides sp.]MAS55515.1 hypothetical protein [Pimelobacter sp.]MDE0775090.1 hypothetical protein [Nocardioides sp.]